MLCAICLENIEDNNNCKTECEYDCPWADDLRNDPADYHCQGSYGHLKYWSATEEKCFPFKRCTHANNCFEKCNRYQDQYHWLSDATGWWPIYGSPCDGNTMSKYTKWKWKTTV